MNPHRSAAGTAVVENIHQVLIIGPPRSGTTLLAFVIGGGSRVLSLSEPYLVRALLPDWRLQRFFRRLQRQAKLPSIPLQPRANLAAFGQFLRQTAAAGGLPIVAIKETFHEYGLGSHGECWRNEGILNELVATSAATIAIVRHPLDTAASTVNLAEPWVVGWLGRLVRITAPRAPYFANRTAVVRTAAANWSGFVEWATARQLPMIRYEDLVADTRGVLGEVCRHLDIPREERMLDYRQPRTAFAGIGDPGVLDRPPRPVDRAAIGRGDTLTAEQQAIVRATCGDRARGLGYEL